MLLQPASTAREWKCDWISKIIFGGWTRVGARDAYESQKCLAAQTWIVCLFVPCRGRSLHICKKSTWQNCPCPHLSLGHNLTTRPDYIQSQTVPPVSIPISRPLLAGWFLGLPACLMANGSQSNVKIQYGYVKISGNLLCLPFSWRQWTIMLKTVLQWEVEKLVCIKQIIAFRKNGCFYLPDETSNFPTQEILPFLDQWANLFFFVSQKFVLSFWPN